MNINIKTSQPITSLDLNIIIESSAVGSASTAQVESAVGTAVLESKADDETDADYSDCQGFLEKFMGFLSPLPALNSQLKRQVATSTENPKAYVLKYQHFNTIHHSVRRMPIVSAINIDGDPGKRRDTEDRKDKWMRDNRIDFDVQLNDAYYKKSNFDKGHMTRREDANWGKNEKEAFDSAQMTCMYTNACLQVPDINRAIYGYHGLWGQLEQIVLEKGAEQEAGSEAKICVYNGPIFTDTDPVFKGVQTPLRFYKVIVWLNAAKEKKTTAFILSQEDLVSDIKFEELQYDQEFKEHQCSIAYLEGLTKLVFTEIRDWDTFKNDEPGAKGVKRLETASMEFLVKANSGK